MLVDDHHDPSHRHLLDDASQWYGSKMMVMLSLKNPKLLFRTCLHPARRRRRQRRDTPKLEWGKSGEGIRIGYDHNDSSSSSPISNSLLSLSLSSRRLPQVCMILICCCCWQGMRPGWCYLLNLICRVCVCLTDSHFRFTAIDFNERDFHTMTLSLSLFPSFSLFQTWVESRQVTIICWIRKTSTLYASDSDDDDY